MLMDHTNQIRMRICELEVEHRDLDSVIEAIVKDPNHDELQLRRLKKRKLQLKDYIALLKMQLSPDIPA
ncbi:YdcH family protein [Undibacterium baiyunense]|uniref:YdcH family protein n=1 Tax=Undibacterium baiyunense TaxID=2828731 RepID=UPI003F6A1D19